MKILLATSRAIPGGGGIASYNQELAQILGKEHDIYLLTDSDEENVDGYRKTFSTFGEDNKDKKYCKDLVKTINEANYDVIINSASNFIPVIAPYLYSRIVSVSHFVNGKLAFNAAFNHKFISGIVVLSEYGKKFIIDKYKVKDRKIEVIYNFINIQQEPDYTKITRNKPIKIVYPGGTSIAKSSDVVQQLIYRLQSSGYDFEFIWFGGTRIPSAKFSILGLADLKDLFDNDSRVKILGKVPRDEAMRLIASSNIFLLPSRGEGCPMTLLEAMGGGCIPIVSDAKHGSREILEKAKTGFIVKQGSYRELFDAIVTIINSHDDFVNQYKSSFDYMEKNLSQEKWKDKMNSFLIRCGKENRPVESWNDKHFLLRSYYFNIINYYEEFKLKIRSISYRGKYDVSYLLNKINFYKK